MQSEVYIENCVTGMKKFPDKHFDLAIVDPPYGINATNMQMGTHKTRSKDGYPGISTATKIKGRLNTGSGKLKNRILNKSVIDWDNEKPSKEYFDELFRVSKNQIIWGGNYFDLPPTRCFIVWNKNQPWDNFSQAEIAWNSFDKPAKLFTYSNRGGNNEEKKIHPTQKPVYLYDYCFKHFATEGMKILDTHLGSGSSRISADKYKLNFIAYETNDFYAYEQEKRFKTIKIKLNYNYKQQFKTKMKITITKLAMTVTCKCGGVVAATMLYGGVEINAEFMDMVAQVSNEGGKIEIINTDETPVKLSGCSCK